MLNKELLERVLSGDVEGIEVVDLCNLVKELNELKKGGKEGKRKMEVLEILKEGNYEICEIAEKLGISSKNVSSILSYLKKDGWRIWHDEEGRKILKGKKEENIEEEVAE